MLMTAEYTHSAWLLDPIRLFYVAEHIYVTKIESLFGHV